MDSNKKSNKPETEETASYAFNCSLSYLVDKRQKNGKWAPVFGPPDANVEEKYIEKMIEIDKKFR